MRSMFAAHRTALLEDFEKPRARADATSSGADGAPVTAGDREQPHSRIDAAPSGTAGVTATADKREQPRSQTGAVSSGTEGVTVIASTREQATPLYLGRCEGGGHAKARCLGGRDGSGVGEEQAKSACLPGRCEGSVMAGEQAKAPCVGRCDASVVDDGKHPKAPCVGRCNASVVVDGKHPKAPCPCDDSGVAECLHHVGDEKLHAHALTTNPNATSEAVCSIAQTLQQLHACVSLAVSQYTQHSTASTNAAAAPDATPRSLTQQPEASAQCVHSLTVPQPEASAQCIHSLTVLQPEALSRGQPVAGDNGGASAEAHTDENRDAGTQVWCAASAKANTHESRSAYTQVWPTALGCAAGSSSGLPPSLPREHTLYESDDAVIFVAGAPGRAVASHKSAGKSRVEHSSSSASDAGRHATNTNEFGSCASPGGCHVAANIEDGSEEGGSGALSGKVSELRRRLASKEDKTVNAVGADRHVAASIENGSEEGGAEALPVKVSELRRRLASKEDEVVMLMQRIAEMQADHQRAADGLDVEKGELVRKRDLIDVRCQQMMALERQFDQEREEHWSKMRSLEVALQEEASRLALWSESLFQNSQELAQREKSLSQMGRDLVEKEASFQKQKDAFQEQIAGLEEYTTLIEKREAAVTRHENSLRALNTQLITTSARF